MDSTSRRRPVPRKPEWNMNTRTSSYFNPPPPLLYSIGSIYEDLPPKAVEKPKATHAPKQAKNRVPSRKPIKKLIGGSKPVARKTAPSKPLPPKPKQHVEEAVKESPTKEIVEQAVEEAKPIGRENDPHEEMLEATPVKTSRFSAVGVETSPLVTSSVATSPFAHVDSGLNVSQNSQQSQQSVHCEGCYVDKG